MAGANNAVIIKKVKKGGGDGHHGGAWKVAYADFVTAMMAFFMLMWLLNATSEEQREGIADYFSPSLPLSDTSAGGASFFNGDTVHTTETLLGDGDADGGFDSESAEEASEFSDPAEEDAPVRAALAAEAARRVIEARALEEEAALEAEIIEAAAADGASGDDAQGDMEASEMADVADAGNAAPTDDAAVSGEGEGEGDGEGDGDRLREIADAFESVRAEAEGSALFDHVTMRITPEGLMIEIVDRRGEPLFESGSSEPSDLMIALVDVIAPIIAALDNDVAIVGHTDATPFASGSGRTNWTLSAERADAARRLLMERGLSADRLARIAGAADRYPLSDDPYAPENRRIGITLLRRAPNALDAAE